MRAVILALLLAGPALAQQPLQPSPGLTCAQNTLCDVGTMRAAGVPLATIAGAAAGAAQTGNNLSDLASATAARANLGLGSIATQSAGTVAITGGSISGANVSGANVTAGSGGASKPGAAMLFWW